MNIRVESQDDPSRSNTGLPEVISQAPADGIIGEENGGIYKDRKADVNSPSSKLSTLADS